MDENPAKDRTSKRERGQRQGYSGWPVIAEHSARPKNNCTNNDAKN